jgi:hypothetical protein
MSVKTIAFLKRKAGLSREAFIDYYETRHVVLIRSLFPEIAEYRRNYLGLEDGVLIPGDAPLGFDVVTEILFADRATYDRFWTRAADPEVARKIAEDEENVFDRSATRMVVVETRGDLSA